MCLVLDVGAQIDERIAALRQVQRAQRRLGRNRGDERTGRDRELRGDDLPGLIEHGLAKRHFALDPDERHAVFATRSRASP